MRQAGTTSERAPASVEPREGGSVPPARSAPATDAAGEPSSATITARRIPALLAAAFALLVLSLVFTNPPGAAPDEAAHYLRALGVGRGQLVLERPPPGPAAPAEVARQTEWMWMQSGTVELPESFDPAPFECWAHPFYYGNCDQPGGTSDDTREFSTYVGAYPPFPYVLSGVLMRAAGTPVAMLMLGRAGIALLCLVLVAAASFALARRDRPQWPLGLLLALSPMVLYLSASLSSSGVEISASVCFLACLLRIVRKTADPAPSWVWIAAGASGLVLALSRELGPAWLVLHLVLAGIFAGRRRLQAAWSTAPSRVRLPAVLTAAAGVVVALVWRAAASVSPDLERLELPKLTGATVGSLLRQVAGVFGPLDAPMPGPAYWLWALLFAALTVGAFASGSGSQRTALVLSALAVAGLTLALEAAQNIYGFGVQARHVLPAVVAVPLLAGEAVSSVPPVRRMPGRIVPGLFAGGVAAVHLIAWITLGRRYAVGPEGPPVFFTQPEWSPAGGWLLWGAVTAVACFLLVLPFAPTLTKGASPSAPTPN